MLPSFWLSRKCTESRLYRNLVQKEIVSALAKEQKRYFIIFSICISIILFPLKTMSNCDVIQLMLWPSVVVIVFVFVVALIISVVAVADIVIVDAVVDIIAVVAAAFVDNIVQADDSDVGESPITVM